MHRGQIQQMMDAILLCLCAHDHHGEIQLMGSGDSDDGCFFLLILIVLGCEDG